MHSKRRPSDSLLFFGEDWGRHNSTGQYLALALNRSYRVIWWDSLGLRRPGFSAADITRMAGKLAKFGTGLVAPHPARSEAPVEVVTPLVLPFHGPSWVGRVNTQIIRTLARKKRAYPPRVMIAACPGAADVFARTPADLKVYYCADEYSALPGMDRGHVQRLEARLLRSVDLVVASSRTLRDAKARSHPNVQYLPHGVDYERFSRALGQTERPTELQGVEGPIVGFVGLLGDHIDTDLLARLARSLPEAEFVFIGPSSGGSLPRGENLHFLGPRPHERLFEYLAHFDVGIVPYRPGPFARNANPTKLREYLAAGVPVVSAPVPEAHGISPYVSFAEAGSEFVAAVRNLLDPEYRPSRRQVSESVRTQSWDRRGEALEAMLREQLGEQVSTAVLSANVRTG